MDYRNDTQRLKASVHVLDNLECTYRVRNLLFLCFESASDELQEKFRNSVRKCVERYLERLDRGAAKHSQVELYVVHVVCRKLM